MSAQAATPAGAPDSNASVAAALRLMRCVAGALVILIGGLVLAGWLLGVTPLTGIRPGWVTMKANAALAFVFAGTSLCLWQMAEARPWARHLARACALAVVLIGGLTLGEYGLGRDFGIDQLLVRDVPGAPGTSYPGRMAPNTAVNFLLLGGALLLLEVESRPGRRPAQYLALAACLIALLALVGYAFSITGFYGLPHATRLAFHTVLGFFILAVGVLCADPSRDLMTVIRSEGPGGLVARRLLPAVLIVPLVLGWVQLLGERRGLYEAAFGVALLVVSTIVLFGALVWWTAHRLYQLDTDRLRAESAVRRLAAIVESSDDAIIGFTLAGVIESWNAGAERTYGYAAAEILGRSLSILIPPDQREEVTSNLARLRRGERITHYETVRLRKDGARIDVALTISPIKDEAGRVTGASGIGRDIAERKRVEDEILRLNQNLERRVAERTAELAAANRELEAFSYSVSHDLRAPLRGIDGFSKLLLNAYPGGLDARAQDYLRRIRAAAQRMGQLIDDLLLLSRITRGEMRRERIDLSALARRVAAELQKDRPEREVVFAIADGLVVTGDGRLLEIALENLLGNAWKFTAKQAQARIEMGRAFQNGQPAYFVRDNGAGFDMAYAGKLFGPFQRLHSPAEFEGTGIGLATVQRIIARHGGRVWAEGTVGRGATFFFTL